MSLRLAPKADGSGRVPACEVLINTAAVRDNIRDVKAQLNIPDLIREGTVQYGMQSFDQSLMRWFTAGEISLETALFCCTNPTEFRLQIEGIAASSDRTFEGFGEGSSDRGLKTKPGLEATRTAKPPPALGGGDASGVSRDPFAR